MPVPDFQTLMRPILEIAKDRQEHSLNEAIELLTEGFELSEEERRELLPSGRQSKMVNRAGWATTYLRKTRLLESTGRGKFKITERGIQALQRNVPINLKYLQQYSELSEFRNPSHHNETVDEPELPPDQTPEEILEVSYQSLRRTLAQEILERIKTCSPRFFEILVVDLLVTMGYGGSLKDAGRAIGQSGDGGIDGIIKEDKLGLDAVYIQAKRWEGTVGRPVVQAFAGSLEGQRARKGVLITTSQFSPDAQDYVTRIEKKIVLIEGEQLAQLMIEHGIGVTEVASYTVKRLDNDYFTEENSM